MRKFFPLLFLLIFVGCDSSHPQYYQELILEGKGRDFVKDYYQNVLQPKENCNHAMEYFNPGYEASSIYEGKVYWEKFIIFKDIFNPIINYLTEKYVDEIEYKNIRWRLFGRNLEDIKYSTAFKIFDGEGEFHTEQIRVSCHVDKPTYTHQIVLEVKMEYFALCKDKTDLYDLAYYDFTSDPREDFLKIMDDEWYSSPYHWDGRSYFDLIPNDWYLNKVRRRSCSKSG